MAGECRLPATTDPHSPNLHHLRRLCAPCVWQVRREGGEEKEEGPATACGTVSLPFHGHLGGKLALGFTAWDQDVSGKTTDEFLGTFAPPPARLTPSSRTKNWVP